MKVRDFEDDEYLIVKKDYWDRFHKNAFVERFSYDLAGAIYIRDALERCDGIEFVIIKNGKEI